MSLHKREFRTINQTVGTPILTKDSSIIYNANEYLIKHNKVGYVEWIKKIPNFRTSYTTATNEIVGLFSSDTISTSGFNSGGITKLSDDGNLIWAKKLNTPEKALGYWNSTKLGKGNNGDIILSNHYNGEIGIAMFNQDLTQTKFKKHFNIILSTGQYLHGVDLAVSKNSIFILCHLYESSFYIQKSDLLLIKVDYETGNIEKTKYLHFNDEITIPISPYIKYQFQGVFSPYTAARSINEKYFVVAGRKGTNDLDNNRLFVMKIDTGLNVEKYVIYTAKNHRYLQFNYLTVLPSISKEGNILFNNIRDYGVLNGYRDSSFYFLVDNQLNIAFQRKLNIANDVLLPGKYEINTVPLLKDNGDVFLIFHTRAADAGLINIINIPSGYKELPCRGEDADYITTEMPGFTVLPSPVISELPPLNISITPYNDLKVHDDSIEVNKFCVYESICDSIRISNNSNACMVGDTATFALIKNPQCLSETIWEVDSNLMKILSIGDTLLKLQYQHPASGYIKARFKNCDIADSFFVDIKERLAPLSIGPDTVLCPGNSYIIQATAGYMDYLWNNGKQTDSIAVSIPGIYHVFASDYCGNTFRDTVAISRLPHQFSFNYPGSICNFDTAAIALDPSFANYKWQPETNGLIQGNRLLLFPNFTTSYTITAVAFPKCIVSDSVKIVVDDCADDVLFPNAFSPNNDGLNDQFRPVSTRKLQHYRLSIYNRYGQKVFQSTDPNDGWNGWYKGEMSAVGVYSWMCEYRFRGSSNKLAKGSLTLVR